MPSRTINVRYRTDLKLGSPGLSCICRSKRSRLHPASFHAPNTVRKSLAAGSLVDVLLSVSTIHGASGQIIGASKIAHDISAKMEADRLQAFLIGELHHRVKNIFATVIAIARQTFASAANPKGALAAFEARLSAMAHAYDLLAEGDWQSADLAVVVEQAVAPYPPERFNISGPTVLLFQKAVAALSLALHELGTNAAKYGALSVPRGKVSVNWHYDPEASALSLRWEEIGGPDVVASNRKALAHGL
jgi:two-component sensor histidine kinase